ncbi:MAG: flagellar motor switch protein FliN [Acidobacteria bacterium]|nr:flagellar motor switch protein FliN [Acidobacteriota bacterium]
MRAMEQDAPVNELAALERAIESGGQGAMKTEPTFGSASPGFMDIEIPVAISFGRARVALKDAMRLAAGSVVRLDRTMTDPVDIMVNGTPVARGEVVEVNGNFAVRITEVLRRPGGQARSLEQL